MAELKTILGAGAGAVLKILGAAAAGAGDVFEKSLRPEPFKIWSAPKPWFYQTDNKQKLLSRVLGNDKDYFSLF